MPTKREAIWTHVIATTDKAAPSHDALTKVSSGGAVTGMLPPGTRLQRILQGLLGTSKRPSPKAPKRNDLQEKYWRQMREYTDEKTGTPRTA